MAWFFLQLPYRVMYYCKFLKSFPAVSVNERWAHPVIVLIMGRSCIIILFLLLEHWQFLWKHNNTIQFLPLHYLFAIIIWLCRKNESILLFGILIANQIGILVWLVVKHTEELMNSLARACSNRWFSVYCKN